MLIKIVSKIKVKKWPCKLNIDTVNKYIKIHIKYSSFR